MKLIVMLVRCSVDFCSVSRLIPFEEPIQNSFAQKNNKLRRLIQRTDEVNIVRSVVPVKDLSGYDIDTKFFNKGLKHSFTDKNRYVKRNIAVEFELLAIRVGSNVSAENKENFTSFCVATRKSLHSTCTRIEMIHSRTEKKPRHSGSVW